MKDVFARQRGVHILYYNTCRLSDNIQCTSFLSLAKLPFPQILFCTIFHAECDGNMN